MKRKFITYPVLNFTATKNQMLNWANQFSIFCFLDNNKYNFSVDGNTGYATFSIYRTQGYSENVDAIKVIGVSLNYLRNQEYSLDYADFASVKGAFGLP